MDYTNCLTAIANGICALDIIALFGLFLAIVFGLIGKGD